MELKIEEIASALFLTKEASKVYIELLTHTQLTQEEIKKFLKFSDSQLKISLELLLQKGFICQAEKNIFKLSSLFQIEEKIEHDKKVLYNLQRYILPKAQQKDLSIVKYEGIEGVRKVYLEVLEEAKATGETILAYESGLDAITIGSLFVDRKSVV